MPATEPGLQNVADARRHRPSPLLTSRRFRNCCRALHELVRQLVAVYSVFGHPFVNSFRESWTLPLEPAAGGFCRDPNLHSEFYAAVPSSMTVSLMAPQCNARCSKGGSRISTKRLPILSQPGTGAKSSAASFLPKIDRCRVMQPYRRMKAVSAILLFTLQWVFRGRAANIATAPRRRLHPLFHVDQIVLSSRKHRPRQSP